MSGSLTKPGGGDWQPIIKKPFMYSTGIEVLIPRRIGVWRPESVREWCNEATEFILQNCTRLEFPALSSTTLLSKDQKREETTFSMRHIGLSDSDLLEQMPIGMLNLIANYRDFVSVGARDMVTHLHGKDSQVKPLEDGHHRRVEAFVINPEEGESSDWHVDGRLTLPLYLQDGGVLIVSHLTNPRTAEDLSLAPVTIAFPTAGEVIVFDGVNHYHKGMNQKDANGDRVVMGVMYDITSGKIPTGPPFDKLIAPNTGEL